MEISVENRKNEEDKGHLNLFHKGDVIIYDKHYYLIVAIDKDDDKLPLNVSQLDDFDDSDESRDRWRWIGLPENPEEDYTIGVNFFPASQCHLSIIKNGN